jgi:uncharacterized membrane protein YhiD involved in acid resistance|tara:strand:+ start:1125 stop:1808 length:684 start_codon:yes stop_codon:yes gene_type:complete
MNQNQAFQQFLNTYTTNVPVVNFLINLMAVTVLSYLLSRVYQRYGENLSNRELFGRNFVLISMTTMLIISIVKSSLALSLGLVGALSIVRFRAAVKEPEELSYLFLCIAIGLGMGADQGIITMLAFVIIVSVIIFRNHFKPEQSIQNFYLTVYNNNSDKVRLDKIVSIIKENCLAVDLTRFDEDDKSLESTFRIECQDFNQLNKCKTELQKINKSLKISFLDNKGLA